jgi:hypothetical protein
VKVFSRFSERWLPWLQAEPGRTFANPYWEWDDLLGRNKYPPAKPEVERCFQQAVKIAQRQEAKTLELLAIMSLSGLWYTNGQHEIARHRLEEVYHWFTEGFETPLLQGAKKMLTDWSA